MNYEKIDLTHWKRGDMFRYYTEHMRVVLSLTVDIDVTQLICYAQDRGFKFHPCMLWVVSKVINSHDEFKYAWNNDGDLIKWEVVSPSHTVFHNDDESFTKFVTEYSDELPLFHERFLNDCEKYKNMRGIVQGQEKNSFDASCLPWTKYRHFDFHVYDEGKFLAPVVTWGKYEVECKGTILPLTINIHHAVADGFHVSRFFNEVQDLIDHVNN